MKGKAWKFGSDVNTDEIIPARYLNSSDPAELARHCMEDADPQFVEKMAAGDIIVAEDNFGCGSSREHAPIAIKAAGISCVIANSFARIFFRNSINIGLPIIESPEAVAGIKAGDTVEVDLSAGVVRNATSGAEWRIAPFPEEMQKIIAAGGLMEFVKEQMASG
ncbi:MAG: 3-isopropylmalate dehydratase small subunit [Planctomycetes bacterium]|nr:3-isopropylmalate dehydratase small subunit [Planctomycetota bacterium]